MLDPDDGNPLPARLADQAADVGDDGIALMGAGDDAVLDIDDEKRCVWTVLERAQA